MRFRTRLRAHSAPWVAPFAVALTLFVYYTVSADPAAEAGYGYAPTLVAGALSPLYPFVYALAAALGAWEAGKLTSVPVWRLTPTRSRYRLAADVLWPAVALVWLMLVLSAAVVLLQEGVAPTGESLRPLGMAMSVAAAYTVIGFAVGVRFPNGVAAPVLAVLVFVLVATAVATQVNWWRHLAGRYPHTPEFGEAANWASMAAHALPTVGVALALALLWLPLSQAWGRVALGVGVAVVCGAGAYLLVKDWGQVPAVARGHAPMTCVGQDPQVCMPESAEDPRSVRSDVEEVLRALSDAGVDAAPARVIDSLPGSGEPVRPGSRVWRLPLTQAQDRGDLRYQVARAAVSFPCAEPEPASRRLVLGWAADKAGESETFARILVEDPFLGDAERKELGTELGRVLGQSEEEQKQWYEDTVTRACAAGGSSDHPGGGAG